jgi:hypothetical protein
MMQTDFLLRMDGAAVGTAGGGGRFLGTPQQAYLAGFG